MSERHRPRSFATAMLVAFLLLGIPHARSTDADEAGTVALVSGKALVRHGEIVVPPNAATDPTAIPEVRYSDSYEKELGPNDTVMAGDVVVTREHSYVKIYYRDDSIMDIGPNSTFKVEQFHQIGKIRNISFRLLYGKVRTLVTRALEGNSSYRVATPNSQMGVRGTEFVVHAYVHKNVYQTDITCLEGKVIVDVPKAGPGGTVLMQPVVITPGNSFSGSGGLGTVLRFNVSRLTPTQLESYAAIVPTTPIARGGVAEPPKAQTLPGTGLTTYGQNTQKDSGLPDRRIAPDRKLATDGSAPAAVGRAGSVPMLSQTPAFLPPAEARRSFRDGTPPAATKTVVPGGTDLILNSSGKAQSRE